MEHTHELVIERSYDAPVEKVWQAWTTPELLKQWWGPENVIIPACEVDLRVGGKFYIVMEAGEAMGPYKGTQWPMLAEFTAVDPLSKLSYSAHAWTEGAKEGTDINQTTEIVFTKDGDKTKVKVTATIHNADTAPKMAVQGMEMGFNQQLTKLEGFLAK